MCEAGEVFTEERSNACVVLGHEKGGSERLTLFRFVVYLIKRQKCYPVELVVEPVYST